MERVAVVSKEASGLAPAGLTVDGLRVPDLQDSREADSGFLTCRTHSRRIPGS